jgi:hypothetical protein
MAIQALILSLGLLGAAPSRAAGSDCSAAYVAAYSWDWDISQADWDEACGKGTKPEDFLRQRQADAIKACTARFQGKAPDYKAMPYCARGRSGETALAAELGLPKPEAKSESKTAAPSRPGPDFYRLVVAKGSIFPQSLGTPFPELPDLANWTYRHINVGTADFFVPVQGAGSGSCVIRPEFPSCAKFEPYRPQSELWPTAIVDEGCTGLVSTQRVTWKVGAGGARLHAPDEKKWPQSRADEMFSVLSYIVDKGCE